MTYHKIRQDLTEIMQLLIDEKAVKAFWLLDRLDERLAQCEAQQKPGN